MMLIFDIIYISLLCLSFVVSVFIVIDCFSEFQKRKHDKKAKEYFRKWIALHFAKSGISVSNVAFRHNLKIKPQYFEAVLCGIKNFEVRYNDRDYKVGDTLVLREFDEGIFTGRKIEKRITYILDNPRYCKKGFVILGLK